MYARVPQREHALVTAPRVGVVLRRHEAVLPLLTHRVHAGRAGVVPVLLSERVAHDEDQVLPLGGQRFGVDGLGHPASVRGHRVRYETGVLPGVKPPLVGYPPGNEVVVHAVGLGGVHKPCRVCVVAFVPELGVDTRVVLCRL